MAVKTAASSCELEAKFSFYFNEVHRQGTYDMNYKYAQICICLNSLRLFFFCINFVDQCSSVLE